MLTPFINKITNSIRWGYLTAFILLLISYILTFYSSEEVLNQQRRVNHTTVVISSLDGLLSQVKNAESALRGYLLVRDERFLEDYNQSKLRIDTSYGNLKAITADNNGHLWLDTLWLLIKERVRIMSSTLSRHKVATPDSFRTMVLNSRNIMDSLKTMAAHIQAQENNLMVKRSNRATTFSNFIKVINIASIVIAIVLAFYSISTFNRENKAKHEADKHAEQLRLQLEQRVNELKKLNTELVELKSIEKFAVTGRISRTIAHEVRNPLTNINLATEHLRSEVKPGPETDILFDMITRNSNRINELISDLLNSTKAAQLSFKKVIINDMLDQSLDFAQDRIDLKEIKVIKDYAAGPIHILADVEKINIAFLNIIVNAVEAMEAKKGVLTISTQIKNERCLVTIADNGYGMDNESLSKIFEPYFTTKEKGNGLGLINTQNIILGHHANIFAESEEGKGSSFMISFNYT